MTAALADDDYTPTDADPRLRAALDAAATLHTLYAYRCALYDAQQTGTRPPLPPALSADALVDAYGRAMNEPAARFVPFAAWYAKQQTPQPPRRFAVTGHIE